MSNEKIKLILSYNPDRDDFFPIEGEELDAKNNTYLIIDELEEKSTLSFPETSSLIQKRTIERRVSSYLKVGYPVGNKGLRIGANFPLEKIGVGKKVPEVLMTHGHSFGKSRLQHDEIPDYIEKEDTYDVVPGSAAVKAFESGHIQAEEKEIHLKHMSTEEKPVSKVEPVVMPKSPKLQPTSTETKGTDNEIFALGQFVDQFVRDGKVVMVHMEEGKYKLQTLKNIATRLSYDLDTKFQIEGSDLFEE